MANEIAYSASLVCSKGATVQRSASGASDMAGTQTVQHSQTITTASWQAIDLGNLAGVPKKLMIENLDYTNYVELATDDAGANKTDKITKRDFVLRSPVGTIYAKANTASVQIAISACDQ